LWFHWVCFREERKYIIAELTMRRKALQDENFPSHAMVEEFLHRQPLSKLDLSWKQPDIASFIVSINCSHIENWLSGYPHHFLLSTA
jgi:hypothetical protein